MCDNIVLTALIGDIFATTSEGHLQMEQIYLDALKATCPFSFDLKPSKDVRIKGSLKGTVTSGHPTKTTLFNSMRMDLMARYICWKAGIPECSYVFFVQCDDSLLFLEEQYLD